MGAWILSRGWCQYILSLSNKVDFMNSFKWFIELCLLYLDIEAKNICVSPERILINLWLKGSGCLDNFSNFLSNLAWSRSSVLWLTTDSRMIPLSEKVIYRYTVLDEGSVNIFQECPLVVGFAPNWKKSFTSTLSMCHYSKYLQNICSLPGHYLHPEWKTWQLQILHTLQKDNWSVVLI